MFNKEDKEELKVVAVFGKSFPTIKDENTSPLVINMPEDIDNIDVPEDLLKLEVYEIINFNKKKKNLVRTIYVGEVYTVNEMNKICPRFRFSFGMDWASLCNLGHDSPCVFYKNENGLCQKIHTRGRLQYDADCKYAGVWQHTLFFKAIQPEKRTFAHGICKVYKGKVTDDKQRFCKKGTRKIYIKH